MVLPSLSFYYSALLGAGCRYIRFKVFKKKKKTDQELQIILSVQADAEGGAAIF